VVEMHIVDQQYRSGTGEFLHLTRRIESTEGWVPIGIGRYEQGTSHAHLTLPMVSMSWALESF
jgi:hypothetical protein